MKLLSFVMLFVLGACSSARSTSSVVITPQAGTGTILSTCPKIEMNCACPGADWSPFVNGAAALIGATMENN